MRAFAMLGLIFLFVSVIVFLYWWGRRKERESRDRAA